VSETDSFIEEVSEEVRREKLFGYLRRYGWIAILAVVLLVGGAAYNEYNKAQTRNAAQAQGDAILDALEMGAGPERAEALAAIAPSDASAPIVAMLQSADALEADDAAGAAEVLNKIINDQAQPKLYRDLATLKHTILTTGETDPEDRITALASLTTPGSTFRVLAEEQIALAEIEKGDTEAAILRLRALLEDTEATQGLRVRVQQLIVSLGEEAEPA